MVYPVSVDENGVNFNPDNMEKEKLYHCIFKNNDIISLIIVFLKTRLC